MSVHPQEKFTELPSVITYSVDKLTEISLKIQSGSSEVETMLAQYQEQLGVICDFINQGDYHCIDELSLIYSEGIDELIHSQRPIKQPEIEFMAGIPVLLLDYLNLPGSKIPASILVKYFKNQQWVRPISQDEYQSLMGCISNRHKSEKTEVVSLDDLLLDDLLVKDKLKPVDDLSDNADIVLDLDQFLPPAQSDHSDMPSEQIDEIELSADFLQFDHAGLADDEIINVSDFLDQTEEIQIDDIVVDESDFIAETVELQADSTVDDSVAKAIALDPQQQELVDLVSQELTDVIESWQDLSVMSQEAAHQAITELAEQSENIYSALNLIGLEGIGRAGEIISSNLMKLAVEERAISEDDIRLINKWPEELLGSLQNIFDENKAQQLLHYLQDSHWPEPLQADEASELLLKLGNPLFVEEEVELRQTVALASDVSLVLPEDVNAELLDGLLQDLPSQTEEFSAAIQHLSEGGTLEDIEVAQRIAHTLKGAANVVGVKGIANLTHHLEDILEAQTKAQALPVAPLMDVLVNAADCLEAMTEALMGIDVEPADALQTLQNILDWANQLDRDGVQENLASDYLVPDASSVPARKTDTLVEVDATKAVAKEALPVENMLRISTALADEMLRLAGENLISTAQVQEHIKNILKKQDFIGLHNQSLQQLSNDMEHLIDIQGIASQFNVSEIDSDFDPLEMDQYNELHSVSRRLIELAADSVQLTSSLHDELLDLNNLVIDQNKLQKDSQELVLRTRMVSVKNIIPRIKRAVRQACRVTGKNVELVVDDNETFMDSEVMNDLIDPIMHLIRNAIDHGVELATVRESAGKSATGNVHISFLRQGNQVVINIEDDGKGLDIERIKFKAISKGLIQDERDISDDAVIRLILEPGFTTKDEVTQVSGRGIGLDVVNVKVRELKGTINIYSEVGHGSRFELMLPLSSFSTNSLLVRVRQHVYAISNRGVEEILYPGLGELSDIGDDLIFQFDDEAYDAVIIDDLLKLPVDRRDIDRRSRPILLVRQESGIRSAVLVQDVIDCRDVVVKPMSQYLPKIPGIAGATVLGDGSVSPVIDLPELLQESISQAHQLINYSPVDAPEMKKLPYVLVVDDSLSARQSLAQFVQDLGLEVRTARDGMEAVALIEARQPDLVLVDMEMPRMNGLELTSHIRARAKTVSVPVIMITSRSTDKHRKAALDKGVSHFMVKPFAEDELAQHINTALDLAS